MIKAILEEKYGEFVTNKFLNNSNVVEWDNHNENGAEEQAEVKKHLKSLKDINGEPLIPEKFWLNDVQWGLDFSSWVGDSSNKDFFIIGAEPHLWRNYQLVYDFGNLKNKSTEESALVHYAKDDIWNYLTDNFGDNSSDESIVSFLKKCYITDLCHVVPKYCGQINGICESLGITAKEWRLFRTAVAQRFLLKEIQAVNPKFIILHGKPSRLFFQERFNVKEYHVYRIVDSKYTIQTWDLNGYKVISIPHLKGDVKNKLWKCKKFPKRPESAKAILKMIIKMN